MGREGTEPPAIPAPESEASPDGILQQVLRSAGSDAMRYVPVRFLPALASLISIPVFTAAIGAKEYGTFYLISSIAVLCSNIAVGWIGSSVVRFYWPLKRSDRIDEFTASVLWTSLSTLLATAAIAGAAAWLGRGSLSEDLWRLVPAALIFFVLNYLTDVLAQVLRAAKEARSFAFVQIAGALLSTGISIVLVWWGHFGAAGIFAGGAVAWAIMLVPILRAIHRQGSLSPSDLSRPLLGEFWAYGMPLIPVGISVWALALIDRWVIQVFEGTAAVGLYSVAYSLGDKIMQIAIAPILLTMLPSLMEAYENRGQHIAEKVQTQFMRYFALVTVPLLAGLAAASQPIMHVFTAPEYWVAWRVLPIVAASTVFGAFSQVATSGLAIHKKTHLIMVNTFIAAAFNLVANVVLVPRYGYMAAAFNTVAAYLLMMNLSWLQSRRFMPLRFPWPDFARIVFASVVMGVLVWLPFAELLATASRPAALRILAVQVIAGLVIYPAVLFAVKGFRADEVTLVKDLLGRLRGRS